MNTQTGYYRLAAMGTVSLLVVVVLGLRSHVLLGALWGNSGFVQVNYLLSQKHTTTTLSNETISTLQKATAYHHDQPSAWRALGYVALRAGDQEAAVRAWRNSPAVVGELIEKGQAAQLTNDQDAALTWFSLATRVAPESADGWFFLGLAQEAQGEWSLAIESYTAAVGRPDRARVGDSDPYFRLARARWQVEGVVAQEAILADLQQALEADDFLGGWARAQTHYVRGLVLKEIGQTREAAAEFDQVINHLPDDYWARVQLGLLAWEVDQDVLAAEAWLQAAAEIAPNNKWAYRYLGQIYAANDRPEQAAAIYEQVLALDPNDAVATAFLSQPAP